MNIKKTIEIIDKALLEDDSYVAENKSEPTVADLTGPELAEWLRNNLCEILDEFETRKIKEALTVYMPFGKYSGKTLGNIPLSYLDGTISVMPEQFIVTMARKIVSSAMLDTCFQVHFGMSRPPNKSYNELILQFMKILDEDKSKGTK